jgi:transcriptional regulator with PAS, ATPase and Fis domain
VEIPPLRERRECIHLLVEYFIDRYARKTGKKIRGIERSTLELLRSYAWPGNIRELQNVIERSLIVCETQTFLVDESWLSRQPLPSTPKRALGLSEKLVAQEKEMIGAALRNRGGHLSTFSQRAQQSMVANFGKVAKTRNFISLKACAVHNLLLGSRLLSRKRT